ncbi:Bug family tripartite tricarboxylate transporter substrate binding protein [Pseudoroseomonas ludipueritiae]|uniref:Tripartite tricarboxylate transporter substrate binding protein n=1 Tax=Pseudoroseomonas ludipueritiae TaxID=198093 RepID=A0ABR7R4J0_9PROT|nr:tripartite tricarboxylate transporter substrate-binding protein [Pseudoroseomonas ludipueritiae]MBC9176641.1 tripartite tricarboxylate transporter substrate binding protein [Pseudoroseomonas ludipueritiae]
MVATRRGLLAAAGTLALPLETMAQARPWPDRTVRFVIPFAPGGPVEVPARFIAERLTAALGQSVIVETRPGAGGALGIQYVVQTADPHVLLFTTSSVAVLPSLLAEPGYDPFRDLVPVSMIVDVPMAILVRPDWPARSLEDFLRQARKNPQRFSFGSSGAGSTTHLAGELLKVRAGIDILHVPYRGGAQAVNALYAGDTDMLITGLIETMTHVRDGRLRALAVTSPQRSPALPDIPAVAEEVPDYSLNIWYGLFGPHGTPPGVVQRLASEMAPLRENTPLAERMAASGARLLLDGPGPLEARMRAEVPLWKEVVASAGIKLE